MLGGGVAFEGVDDIDESLIRSAQVPLMLIFWFFAGDHHRLGLSCTGERDVSGSWRLALVLILDVGVESGVAQVALAAHTDVVALHGIVPCPSLTPRLELFLAFVVAHILRMTHLCLLL